MVRSDVLIVGAGPTGLVMALWLTKLGMKVRIIDKTAEPGTTSRALAVQARTLEHAVAASSPRWPAQAGGKPGESCLRERVAHGIPASTCLPAA
jgi:flavin-dependent dehydrogenase